MASLLDLPMEIFEEIMNLHPSNSISLHSVCKKLRENCLEWYEDLPALTTELVESPSRCLSKRAMINDKKAMAILIDLGMRNWDAGLHGAIKGGQLELIEFFIDKGVNKISSMLRLAGLEGNLNTIKFLLSILSASRDVVGEILKGAIRGGHRDVIEFLLENTEASYLLYAAIEYAAGKGSLKSLEFLAKKNLPYLNAALAGAAKGNHRDIVISLIEKGADNIYGALCAAAEAGHVDMVKFLLKQDVTEPDLCCALEMAARKGQLEIARLLIDEGAEDAGEYTCAAESAARNGHLEVVELLLDRGVTKYRNRALFAAARVGHLEIVKLLVRRGAWKLEKALKGAACGGWIDVAKFLIQNGANPKGSLAYALRGGHKGMIAYIEEICPPEPEEADDQPELAEDNSSSDSGTSDESEAVSSDDSSYEPGDSSSSEEPVETDDDEL